jgi:hypothetical protein
MDLNSSQTLSAGTSVAVFSRFSGAWISGFEIAAGRDDAYELRRHSDRSVLPATFALDDLRVEHA